MPAGSRRSTIASLRTSDQEGSSRTSRSATVERLTYSFDPDPLAGINAKGSTRSTRSDLSELYPVPDEDLPLPGVEEEEDVLVPSTHSFVLKFTGFCGV